MIKRILSLLITAGFVLAGMSALAGPMIEIPDAMFDFGRTSQYGVVSHRFTIKSVGDEPLQITKVESGCGCTKAPLEDSTLAPGDSTILEIFFSTRSYRGVVSKRPYVETNINDEKVYVKIKAELFPEPETIEPVHLSPARLDVSQFKPEPRRKARFFICNSDTVDYEITLVDYADQAFDLEMPSVVPAGDSVMARLLVHEDLVKSEFEHSITFEINDADRTRYSLPVKRMYRVRGGSGK
jgi:hypothetical protein